MKLKRIAIKNYRSIEDLTLSFPTFYTAICGRNDSGKTNVVTAIRTLLRGPSPYPYIPDEDSVSVKDDLPKWLPKDSNRKLGLEIELAVAPDADAGLYKFLTTYLSLPESASAICLTLTNTFTSDTPNGFVTLTVDGKGYDSLLAQEVFQKLKSSNVARFHDSTDPIFPFHIQSRLLGELSQKDSESLELAKNKLSGSISRIAKQQQQEMTEILGRLKDRYRVGFSVAKIETSDIPLSMTLGDATVSIPLHAWGSGTKNRTYVLIALFKAHQVSQAETSASKITPFMVVEEPESFLHPAAQAEFGNVLQGLAEEFKVQVIVSTHSPYMLSQASPEANLLLERRFERRKMLDTRLVDTSGDRWMEPFGLALGIDNKQFAPWREALFGKYDSILLVEGDTDKEYIELLRQDGHGAKSLRFAGEVLSYGGRDNLKQRFLLNFIRKKYKKCFVTFDLDAEDEVEPVLKALGFVRNVDYCPVGLDAPGKRAIEGLVPDAVRSAVFAANPDLVQQMMSTVKSEQTSAKNRIKKLLLEEFKQNAKCGEEDYRHFYALSRLLNKGFASAAP